MDFQPKAQRSRASLYLAESGKTADIAQQDKGHIPKKTAMFCGTEAKKAGGEGLEIRAQLALEKVGCALREIMKMVGRQIRHRSETVH